MTYHVVCLAGAEDDYSPSINENDQVLKVPFNIPGHPDSFQTDIYDIFAEYGLMPSPAAHDLLEAIIASYTADVRTSRAKTFDGWTRDIALHLAVGDPESWTKGAKNLEAALSFLTGDHWRVLVREKRTAYQPLQGRKPKEVVELDSETVCLFSGGMDSFIGAVDQLELNKKVVLVGHHSAGAAATSRSQNDSEKALHKFYDKDVMPFLRVWLTTPKGENRASEISTRGRSLLFIGLGVVIAGAIGAGKLIVPENGLISLNVPLTNARLGSFSTRTTHPYFIKLIRDLLSNLDISVSIELPYRFQTKGEMIRNSANRDIIQQNADATISCSHPGASRYSGRKAQNIHCGYCYPCLIRRAAVYSTGEADPTDYVFTDLSEKFNKDRRADLRAVKLALNKFDRKAPRIVDVLTSGPLPASDDDLKQYLAVFTRGLDEVRTFLRQYE